MQTHKILQSRWFVSVFVVAIYQKLLSLQTYYFSQGCLKCTYIFISLYIRNSSCLFCIITLMPHTLVISDHNVCLTNIFILELCSSVNKTRGEMNSKPPTDPIWVTLGQQKTNYQLGSITHCTRKDVSPYLYNVKHQRVSMIMYINH